MKSVYLFLVVFLFTNLCFKCEQKRFQTSTCFEFDKRQCKGDEWADMVPSSDSKEEQESKMKTYLESQDIDVKEVKLVVNFHEAVCEACYVCPESNRFFVRIDEDDAEVFKAMDLLNLGEVECGEVF